MNGIRIQTERKQQDRSVRPAEKRRRRATMMQVLGPIRPVPGAWATTDAAQGEKSLFNWQNQAILTSPGTPLGECRLHAFPLHNRLRRLPRDSISNQPGMTSSTKNWSVEVNMTKTALITGVTGQDGSYLAEVRCAGEPGKRLTLKERPDRVIRNDFNH